MYQTQRDVIMEISMTKNMKIGWQRVFIRLKKN